MYTRTHLTQSDEPRMLRCGDIKPVQYLFSGAILCHVIFSYHLNWMHVTSKVEVDRSKYSKVMAIYSTGGKETASRRKNLYGCTLR